MIFHLKKRNNSLLYLTVVIVSLFFLWNFIAAETVFGLSGDVQIKLKGKADYNFSNEILKEINIQRNKEGLSSLVMDSKLMESADMRARECIIRYSHKRPVADDWISLIPPNHSHVGENLAIGYTEANEVVDAWMSSPSHKANIMGSDYKSVGIGTFVYTNSLTGIKTYTIAQHFSNLIYEESDLKGTTTLSYPVTVNTDIYPLELELVYPNTRQKSPTFIMNQGEEITPVLKVKGSELWGQKYITSEPGKLTYSVAEPKIADISDNGTITAKKQGKTVMEIYDTEHDCTEVLNIHVKRSVTFLTTDLIGPIKYNGNYITPKVNVMDGKTVLTEGKEYKIIYSDNLYPGDAVIHIIGKEDYYGDFILPFSIYDDSTVIKKDIFERLIDFFIS